MAKIFTKSVQSAFLASAMAFTGTSALANDDVKDTFEKIAECEAEKNKKPVYEMNLGELLRKYDGDYNKAWESYAFYQQRQISLEGRVDKNSVDDLITEIEILDTIKPGAPITLTIDSGGGSVYNGLRLYNAMKTAKSPIHTKVDGMAASMAAIILISGDKREATPESRVLIHQVSSRNSGKVYDMEQSLNHTRTLQDDLYQIISENTGLSLKDVTRIAKSDVFYDGEESLRLGFIDVLTHGKEGRDLQPGSRTVPENLYPENRVQAYYQTQMSGPN